MVLHTTLTTLSAVVRCALERAEDPPLPAQTGARPARQHRHLAACQAAGRASRHFHSPAGCWRPPRPELMRTRCTAAVPSVTLAARSFSSDLQAATSILGPGTALLHPQAPYIPFQWLWEQCLQL